MFPDWTNKKAITVAGESGAGTGYQVVLLIGASASATGADFHLEGNSADFPAAENDGGDLRFADAAESAALDFYVESVTGTGATAVAKVWVKVTDDLGTDKDIFVYYNNAAASNGSDPRAAFNFFDKMTDSDFTDQWSVVNGTWIEGSDGLYNTSSSGAIESTTGDCPNDFEFTIEVKHNWSDYVVSYARFFYEDANNSITAFLNSFSSNQQCYLQVRVGGSTVYNNGLKPWNRNSNWRTCKVTGHWTGSTYQYNFYFDDVLRGTYSNSKVFSFTTHRLEGAAVGGSEKVNYKNMRIRKFVPTEPAFSAAAAETSNESAPVIAFVNEDNTVSNNSNFGTSGFNAYGTSFVVPAGGKITAVGIKACRGISYVAGGVMEISIYEGGTTPTNGTLIKTESFDTSLLPFYTNAPTMHQIDFTVPTAELTGGATTYWIALRCTAGHSSDQMRWSFAANNPYAGGTRNYSDDFGSWVSQASNDLNFAIYGTEAVTVTPSTIRGRFMRMLQLS